MRAETGTGTLSGSTRVEKLESRSTSFRSVMATTTVAQARATRF